jgi:hypothetical protein
MSCEVWARLQFNVVPDNQGEDGEVFGGWQFNNVPVMYAGRR